MNARDLSYELSLRADYVARRLLGPPNRKASTKRELRYGRHGSLSVRIAGPKRGRWNDFERGERGDLLDLIRREQCSSFRDACDYARDLLDLPRDDAKPLRGARPNPPPKPEPENRYALHIWNDSVAIIGTPGEGYFVRRFKGRVDLGAVPDLHGVLRWNPRCPWGEGGARHPCIVALWTNILSGAPQAIHRRPISTDGQKLDRWKALGPSQDCCIRLWPDDWVTTGLVLGEGVETTLGAALCIAHRGTLLRPAWAAGDAGHMRSCPVLSGIEALTLLVDHNPLDSKTGIYPDQDAAAQCRQRWRAAGREVIRLLPRTVDSDFADIVAGEVGP
jgi:putative DNA primase/helicase